MLRGELHRAAAAEPELRPGEHRSTAETAWLVALPCAAVTVLAFVLLRPSLQALLYPSDPTLQLLADDPGTLRPESDEGVGYLIAVCGALVVAGAIAALGRSPVRERPPSHRRLVLVTKALLAALVVASFIGQHDAKWTIAYFTTTTLVAAGLIAVALALVATKPGIRQTAGRLARSRFLRTLAWILAPAATTIWLLPAVNTEESIAWAFLVHDTAFHFDETFAVLNGLTPLADFNAQYASLFPYAIALSLLTFGKTLLVFTISVNALSVVALLAVYGVLRRAAGSAALALMLYLPFLATSLFDPFGVSFSRFTPGIYFPMIPFRYGGPYLLAWLLARHLAGQRPLRTWPVFAAAGLVVLNNFEFGSAALAATCTALLWSERPDRRRLAHLLGQGAVGLALALAAVTTVALVRAGTLPDLARMPHFAHLYGVAGYSVARMPGVIGLPLVIYMTYLGALATATVRTLDEATNVVLTGMLAWVGIFGLASMSYYVARSDASLMPMTFSAWALAIGLLTVAVLEQSAVRHTRGLTLPSLAVLFGFGLAVCSLAQLPTPWKELRRISERPAQLPPAQAEWAVPPTADLATRRFVSSIADGPDRFVVRRGAPIALFVTTGHRVADAYGVVDVVPFTGPESMHTLPELDEALDALRNDGGNTALLPVGRIGALHAELERRGFRLLTADGLRRMPLRGSQLPADTLVIADLTKWVDASGLRAPWLH